ncbi:50S ribosomal protein L13 [Patescibacteria group bacterium]|nr:50S ribosomal protein L13 [Patescibacteria group bacterium]MBU1613117.1 50S ribosomal protein L13 [Patescibacteria group bacterium]
MSANKRKKVEIDAAGMAPGRLATQIAVALMGKHKVKFETYRDMGDKVVVLNYNDIRFTGKKLDDKLYRHHSMYPGGLKEIPAKKMMEDPKKLIVKTVEKMLPKNKMRTARLKRISFK